MKNERTCESCVHFRPHYVPWENDKFRKIRCGHCTRPHIRHKDSESEACWRWEEKKNSGI